MHQDTFSVRPASNQRGFTLIELLVVIAIIAVLSSVILVSLTTAKQKAVDAKVKAELVTLSVDAQLYYDANGNAFTTSGTDVFGRSDLQPPCPSAATANSMFTATTPNIATIMTDLCTLSSSNASNKYISKYTIRGCAASEGGICGATYVIAAQLSDATWFCVDSKGAAKSLPSGAAIGSGTISCP